MSDFIDRLADGEERPLFDYTFRGLEELYETVEVGERPYEVMVLWAVFTETQIRVMNNTRSRSWDVYERVRDRLAELNFEFPDEPSAESGLGEFASTDDWPRVGVLKSMGYEVGERDPGRARRREILTRVFESEQLPRVQGPEYMAQWGGPESVSRLRKMTRSLSSFATGRLRRFEGQPDDCVVSWAEDLAWLKQQFYEGRFNFPWPEIDSDRGLLGGSARL